MDTSSTMPDTTPRPRWIKRVAQVAAVLLIVLAMVITPPLLNVNRLQRRIVASMSESLGRPVHLDRVTLHLLPMPGFTLENLVVSEDPAFGSEPTIRANVVTVRLRLSSLWRRQVEISNIKFEVDENGSGPSMNLVRNAEGRWNLESLLMHASKIETAPTVQTKAGSAPRFPYIEASNARVNIKLGDEKLPFSLTEADFALWLPEPQQWRVRLEAKPARTDTDIHDSGILRLEGSLNRAPNMADVPVDLHASWHNAPLGDATRVVTGEDRNWRGTLTLDALLTGNLGSAAFTSRLTLNDLRRADFVPANPLDVTITCSATTSVPTATLTNASCSLPTSGEKPVIVSTPSLTLERPNASSYSIKVDEAPVTWALNWMRLYSQRIPATLQPAGTISGELTRPSGDFHDWTGGITATLPQAASAPTSPDTAKKATDVHPPLVLLFVPSPRNGDALQASPQVLQLFPVALHPGVGSTLMLSGNFDFDSGAVQISGTATRSQLEELTQIMPPITDGILKTLPEPVSNSSVPDTTVHTINVQCQHPWNAPQTCTSAAPAPVKPSRRSR